MYFAGKKNHFTLLGANEASKFDYIYGTDNQTLSTSKDATKDEVSEFSEVEEDPADLHAKMGIELEDIHQATK